MHYLREQVGKVGTVVGCDTSNCGACTVDLDGSQRQELHRARRAGRRRHRHHRRGAGRRRLAGPGAAGVPREPRAAVRLLHPGHDHGRPRPADEQPEPVASRRSARASRATCAAAPATRTSSAPSRPRRRRGWAHDHRRGAPRRPAEIGQSRRRKEDRHLITGRTIWTDNITLPGMLHLAMLRSPMAHARISAHRHQRGQASRPGVLGRVHRAGLQGRARAPAVRLAGHSATWSTRARRALAVDQVNFAGECVAVVVARSKAEAQDALEGDRRRLRPAAARAGHGGGGQGRRPAGAPEHRPRTSPTPGPSSPARPAPARRSRRRCATPR